MPEILHVSDLHFGPPFLRDRAEAVRRLAERHPPDVIVVSGDFTQRAREDQFEAAAAFLAEFDVPLVVTPGNHDVPLYRVLERFLAPYRLYRRYIDDRLDAVHDLSGMTIVTLNSTRSFTFSNGRLTRRQLEFAARALEASPPENLRVVVTHHHLAPPPDFGRARVMPGARRALRLFQSLDVHLILAGHMHRSYIGDSLDFFPGADREEGIVVVQCGTTTSARGRGRERLGNSLNHILADREEIRVTHYLWRNEDYGFWPHSEHRFATRPDVWMSATDAPRARLP
jgi:3',5'-cyclic AMP phosphodiesterase CpdA